MNTIESQWNKFTSEAVNVDADPQRIEELKLAFFAGAWSMMGLQHKLVEEGYSEPAGVAIMAGVYEEMKMFFERINNEESQS